MSLSGDESTSPPSPTKADLQHSLDKVEKRIAKLEGDIRKKDWKISRLEAIDVHEPHFDGNASLYAHWKECILGKFDDDPASFNCDERKISYLMRHISGTPFEILRDKYCYDGRGKAWEDKNILTLEDALSELDFVYRHGDPQLATYEMEHCQKEEGETFATFFPKFMSMVNRGASPSKSNAQNGDGERDWRIVALKSHFDLAWHKYTVLGFKDDKNYTFEQYVDTLFVAHFSMNSDKPGNS